MSENRHLTLMARIAVLVTVGDLATKAAAKALLSSEATWFASWLHFAVVHNEQGAFGWSAGVYTWQLNLALTLAAIVFMVPVTRDLSRIDAQAPLALGFIVGGALGNLASLVTSPHGVVDFIQVDLEEYGLALNVADVAAYAGLAMILRTGALVVAALRREARVREPSRLKPVQSVFALRSALTERSLGAIRVEPTGAANEVMVLDFSRVAPADARLADVPLADVPLADVPLADVPLLDVAPTPEGNLESPRESPRRDDGVVGDISPPRPRLRLRPYAPPAATDSTVDPTH